MIKKSILYFILTTLLLYGLRTLHYYGLLKQEKGYNAKYKTAFLEKNEFDVLFLGSSRAEMHYDPRIFDSITGKNSFNLGTAGATPKVTFALLKAYLYNSKMPRYVVYEVDYQSLKKESEHIKQFNNFFPFLCNPVLLEEFNRIDPRMKHFYYNPYYSFPYTGFKSLSSSLHGWLNIPGRYDSAFYKGYVGGDISIPFKYQTSAPGYGWIHVTERSYLDSIISICRNNNSDLVLVSSPIFGGGRINILNKDQLVSQIENIASLHKITYRDFSSLPFCNQTELFRDPDHLNALGSEKYTKVFSLFFNNKIARKSLND